MTQEKTLRDEFAMEALNSLVREYSGGSPETIAEQAYVIADAMLKAREQTTS